MQKTVPTALLKQHPDLLSSLEKWQTICSEIKRHRNLHYLYYWDTCSFCMTFRKHDVDEDSACYECPLYSELCSVTGYYKGRMVKGLTALLKADKANSNKDKRRWYAAYTAAVKVRTKIESLLYKKVKA